MYHQYIKLSLFNETGPEAFTEWGRLFHTLSAWQILLNMLTCRSGVLSRFTDLGSRYLLFRFGGWGVFQAASLCSPCLEALVSSLARLPISLPRPGVG